MNSMQERIAVCPGTYDPITYGHIDVVERAAAIFDHVVLAVVNHQVRKNEKIFSIDERVSLATEAVAHLEMVEVKPFNKLIVDFAREQGAIAIVKGLRAISDFEYEFEMNQLNRKLGSDIESVYLMASPQYSFLSSSGVKEMATFGADISDLVPPQVAKRLQEELART